MMECTMSKCFVMLFCNVIEKYRNVVAMFRNVWYFYKRTLEVSDENIRIIPGCINRGFGL